MSLPPPDPPRKPERPPHVCDPEVCGITFDAGCPLWDEPEPERGSWAWRMRLEPEERAAYAAGVGVLRRLRAVGPEARQALLELLRDDIERIASEVLAEDLPAALAACMPGGRP